MKIFCDKKYFFSVYENLIFKKLRINLIILQDVLVLLDLLGAANPNFYNFFDNTARWYSQLILAENRLHELSLLKNYDGHIPSRKYFQPQSVSSYIEDDHIPFLKKSEFYIKANLINYQL